ncbi:MAG TPA: DoxX family protein [Chthoniobacterales bacterium]|nr:DoxX family protein [Chthoniobacterales bacterium]
MISRLLRFDWFRQRREYGVIFLRLLIGSFIVWGVQDNILSHERMVEFERFLATRGTPWPAFAARLSVYAQFICGISILLGAFVRPLSIVFIVNFVCAIFIAHLGQTFQQMFPALMMIAAGLFFLFHGAGKLSVDELLERRAKSRPLG